MVKKGIGNTRLNLLAGFLALLSSFSLVVNLKVKDIPENVEQLLVGGVDETIWKLASAFNPPSYYVLLMVIMAFFGFRFLIPRVDKRNFPVGIPFSAVSSLALLLCDSYYWTNSWDLVFGSTGSVILSLIRGVGISVLIFFAFDAFTKLKFSCSDCDRKFSAKSFFVVTGLIFLCWVPYMVIMSPGSMAIDTKDQFGQIMGDPDMCWSVGTVVREEGDILLTNHHPVFHTVILGAFLKLGEAMGSYFAGIMIYSVLQCAAFSASLSYIANKLREYGASQKYYKLVVAFFALCPLFPLWGMTVFKDTPFMIALVMVVVLIYDAFRQPDNFKWYKYAALVFFVFALMLFRNNGFYILLVMLPFIIIHFRKNRKFLLRMTCVLLIPLVIFKVGYTGFFFDAMGINEGSPREMLSVPFIQTARYVTEYKDEITPREEESILQILGGGKLTLDDIADEYVPDRADSIKRHYNKYADTDDLVNYFKTWAAQLAKHPDVYVEAFLNLNYPWFSFNSRHDIIYYDGVSDKEIPKFLEGLDNPECFDGARSVLKQTVWLLDRIPVISCVFELSAYTWLYVALFIVMLMKKKHKELLACLPVFLNLGICFIGPVVYMRYVIPMAVLIPFVLFITMSESKGDGKNINGGKFIEAVNEITENNNMTEEE